MVALASPFTEPVDDAQQAFRAVLQATARPGLVQSLHAPEAPAPLHAATWAVCLTLMDLDTPVWLAPELASGAVRESLAFHSGCPLMDRPGEAAFVLTQGTALPALDTVAIGSDEAPDAGATVIAQVDALGSGTPLRLAGPGIQDTATLAVQGADPALWSALTANRRLFPSGFDVLLAAPQQVAALPRTVRIQEV